MPFNDETIFGYTAAFLIQLIGSWVICAIICTVNSFFFGICWYIEALLFDLKSIFKQINNCYEDGKHHMRIKSKERVVNKYLNKFVKRHVDIIK